MATLTRQQIEDALAHLGRLASQKGETIQLVLVGGALMALEYEARPSTRDVDVVIVSPKEARIVREFAAVIAKEKGWPDDWLNDGAKGYLIGISDGPVVFSTTGIEVRRPSLEQLLAMKLCAWRDDVDISDAQCLLKEIAPEQTRDDLWKAIEPYLVPGRELKAQYAFGDLWESLHGDN